jgi:hypothetical protein
VLRASMEHDTSPTAPDSACGRSLDLLRIRS